jgi:hypothetical protein
LAELTGGRYRLGDGMVLGIGLKKTMLVDVTKDDEIKIADPAFAAALESLAMGSDLVGYEDMLPRLVADGMVVDAAAGVDPVLHRALQRLDRMVWSHRWDPLPPRAQRAHALTVDAHAWRKRFFNLVGQCPTLPETTLRRALLVGDSAEVGVKEILCVGDDDFVSVPLAALGHHVTVLDIDPYLLALLSAFNRSMGLSISYQARDLLAPLPPEDLGRFDLFITDPMSNRDCFSVFLSRALAMTKPGGRGFCAVYGPAGRLFDAVAAEMHLPIRAWYARHNRYYSQYFKLHTYESDWVEVERPEDVRLLVAPEKQASSPNLYAEAFFQRKPTFCAFYDDIEDLHHAKPLFLDMVIDMVEQGASMKLTGRVVHPGEGWSVIHGMTRDGHLTMHVDRDRAQIALEIFPSTFEIEDVLRHSLMSAYKRKAQSGRMSNDRDLWDLRVR